VNSVEDGTTQNIGARSNHVRRNYSYWAMVRVSRSTEVSAQTRRSCSPTTGYVSRAADSGGRRGSMIAMVGAHCAAEPWTAGLECRSRPMYVSASLRRGRKPQLRAHGYTYSGDGESRCQRAPAARHPRCCRAWSSRAVARGMCCTDRRTANQRVAPQAASQALRESRSARVHVTTRATLAVLLRSARSARKGVSFIATRAGFLSRIAKSSSPT